ncbi:fluoride efflux transporter CrcB [Chthonobacter rhizosphaerae]|uniref:fluoride efflux transporter CrcB n=1 Tax=Chthonobacter rhizosphaerae TaxID=2735553 RepID=UPI0015EFCB30|nr:fluoride efflux transporter CrcB [Chthonobacter rhizosphaerae]
MSLFHLLVVAVGGAAGSVCRYAVTLAAARVLGPGFPWGTLVVNVVGSAAMGLLVGVLAARSDGGSQAVRLLIATGFLGGFTTLSSFSLDAVMLYERGEGGAALIYVAASILLSLGGLVAGLALVRTLA